MSIGMHIAIGVALIAMGSAGYERYMLQGDTIRATLDVVSALVGLFVLASGIDRARPP